MLGNNILFETLILNIFFCFYLENNVIDQDIRKEIVFLYETLA
jgi:hypothetical protein